MESFAESLSQRPPGIIHRLKRVVLNQLGGFPRALILPSGHKGPQQPLGHDIGHPETLPAVAEHVRSLSPGLLLKLKTALALAGRWG